MSASRLRGLLVMLAVTGQSFEASLVFCLQSPPLFLFPLFFIRRSHYSTSFCGVFFHYISRQLVLYRDSRSTAALG